MLDSSGMSAVRLELQDGIAILTIDVPGRALNVLTRELRADLATAIERIAASPDVRGAIVTATRGAFLAGADLKDLLAASERGMTAAEGAQLSQEFSRDLRRLETCGKPFAAAINGAALGAGLELALACHYRVLADAESCVVGLPEVTVGLLPGAGGTQRLPRLIGIEQALPLLTQGKRLQPQEALRLGIVHELAAPDEVLAAARRWLSQRGEALAPWDRKGYTLPGGAGIYPGGPVATTFITATSLIAKTTQHNYPAPIAILSAVFEGTQVPIDRGLAIESKYFGQLLAGPVARNLIRTMFINRGTAEKLARRPAGVPRSMVRKLGVLGAGMMGAGIAYVSAAAGMEVVLLDSTPELAAKGKAYSEGVLRAAAENGRTPPQRSNDILGRIQPTIEYADLTGCDLIIEAVFENRAVKARVTRSAEQVIPASAIVASNTSTLPIGGLAEASCRPEQFIGIHFFSPVEKMPLVEVIVGQRTSEETLARALDYVGQLRKVPIVVRDSRGFFTSRCFGTYSIEGQQMLAEGIAPALIENAGRMAGMPVGPLAVTDEVSLQLQYEVIRQSRADLGDDYEEPIAWPVIRHFVEDLKRPGRKAGAGFYDYPPGEKKRLWPGLAAEYPACAVAGVDEIVARLLYVQALEAARCYLEGVVTSAAEADLGSILGWGFPAHTGGVLSFIDNVGVETFTARCRQLAKRFGKRFTPPRGLLQLAPSRGSLHPGRSS